MKLVDVHPFRWVRERPALEGVIRNGHAELDRHMIVDLVDLQDGNLGTALDALMVGSYPSSTGLDDEARERYLRNERTAFVSTARFFVGGRNVVTATPDLIADLKKTDLDQVALADLRFPFERFHVAFDAEFGETIHGSNALVDGVTIDVSQSTEDEVDISVLVTTVLKTRQQDKGKRIRAPHHASPVFAVTMNRGATLTEMLEQDFDLQENAGDDAWQIRLKEAKGTVRSALSLAFNLVAYMTSEPDDVVRTWTEDAPLPKGLSPDSGGRLSAAALNRLDDEGFVVIHLAGRKASAYQASRPRKALAESIERRGHWRRQRVGEGRRSIRLLWVRPTWVRPDLPQATTNRLYLQHSDEVS